MDEKIENQAIRKKYQHISTLQIVPLSTKSNVIPCTNSAKCLDKTPDVKQRWRERVKI